jgi:hypothetical protein
MNRCEFKAANLDTAKQADIVPVIDEEQAKVCVPEGYPEEERAAEEADNQ